jgi:hypothetical protein
MAGWDALQCRHRRSEQLAQRNAPRWEVATPRRSSCAPHKGLGLSKLYTLVVRICTDTKQIPRRHIPRHSMYALNSFRVLHPNCCGNRFQDFSIAHVNAAAHQRNPRFARNCKADHSVQTVGAIVVPALPLNNTATIFSAAATFLAGAFPALHASYNYLTKRQQLLLAAQFLSIYCPSLFCRALHWLVR